jgi:hypothetical protein
MDAYFRSHLDLTRPSTAGSLFQAKKVRNPFRNGNPRSVRGNYVDVAAKAANFSPGGSVQGIRRKTMLWTITILLVVLWILGLVSSYTLGGWIHILLVLAVIVLIFNLLSGRRAL